MQRFLGRNWPWRDPQAAARMKVERDELRLLKLAYDRLGGAWPYTFEKVASSTLG
jgi:hypothetical protein